MREGSWEGARCCQRKVMSLNVSSMIICLLWVSWGLGPLREPPQGFILWKQAEGKSRRIRRFVFKRHPERFLFTALLLLRTVRKFECLNTSTTIFRYVKGIVHSRLKFPPFTTHPYVNGQFPVHITLLGFHSKKRKHPHTNNILITNCASIIFCI